MTAHSVPAVVNACLGVACVHMLMILAMQGSGTCMLLQADLACHFTPVLCAALTSDGRLEISLIKTAS